MIYLTLIALGWFIVEFEPIHFVLKALYDKVPSNDVTTYLYSAFSCWQCMTFWSAIVLTHDFYVAIIASLGSMLLETLVNRWTR